VRVRPLTAVEGQLPQLQGLRLDSSAADEVDTVVLAAKDSYPEEAEEARRQGHPVRHEREAVCGFTGVLGQEADNTMVFERCFASRVGTVLRGGTASLFCYGYTGGGKTHTTIGYGEEHGMYYLAAARLLAELNPQNDGGSAATDEGALFLRATACEIYNDKVFDLLGEKVEMTLVSWHFTSKPQSTSFCLFRVVSARGVTHWGLRVKCHSGSTRAGTWSCKAKRVHRS
jgi:hypothetical protein